MQRCKGKLQAQRNQRDPRGAVNKGLYRKRRSSVSVVQAPRAPLEAKSLRPVIAVVGVFLSLCAALLVAFFLGGWMAGRSAVPGLDRNGLLNGFVTGAATLL